VIVITVEDIIAAALILLLLLWIGFEWVRSWFNKK